MFGIGFLELVVIVVVALVCVGPQRLPDLMHQLGRFFVQIRRLSSDVKSSIEQVIQDAEEELQQEEQKKLETKIAEKMAEKPLVMAGTVANASEQPQLEKLEEAAPVPSTEPSSSKAAETSSFAQIGLDLAPEERPLP